jgi:hypothetical protein
LITSTLSAQFSGLSSTADGSSIYFATTLFLRGTPRLLNGKIFVASQDGVSLFRAREPSGPPADALPCAAGGFAGYLGAETSAAGVVALSYRANSSGGRCSFPVNTFMTEILTDSEDTSLPGIVRLSAGGRYALVYLAATGRPRTSFVLSFLDLRTGAQTLDRRSRRDDLGEIKRGMIAGSLGLDTDGSAIGLYVPRDDDTHALRCELHHWDFALADPHRHIAEPVIERDGAVDHRVRKAGVYQLDIRIGPTPGYQKFLCSLGGTEPGNFLTLYIVP